MGILGPAARTAQLKRSKTYTSRIRRRQAAACPEFTVHSQTSVGSLPPAVPLKWTCGMPRGWSTKRVPDANVSAPPSQLFPGRLRVAERTHQTYRVASVADAVSNNEQNSEEAGHEDVEQNQGKSRGDCVRTPQTGRKQRHPKRSPKRSTGGQPAAQGRHGALNSGVR